MTRTYINPAAPRACVTLAAEKPTRTVTYLVNTHATSARLIIPFAVVVDGNLLPEFVHRVPARVSGDNGEIRVEQVAVGSTVALYLNSDAHPDHRQSPVFEFTLEDSNHDVEIWITEETGRHTGTDHDAPKFRGTDSDKTTDIYEALLTGDVWMKVSHKYTAEQAAELMPAGTAAAVTAAVHRIFAVLPTRKLVIPRPGLPTKPLTVTFADSGNPNHNIARGYDLLREGLPRVHPAGYAALFTAALAAGAATLSLSSAWRPCLGSIAHRAGLGLDVDAIDDIPLNRQELRDDTSIDTANVSEKERRLFKDYEAAMADEAKTNKQHKTSQQDLKKAEAALDRVNQAEHKLQTASAQKGKKSLGPARLAEAHAATEQATIKRDAARTAADDAEKAWKDAVSKRDESERDWSAERDRHQPEVVRMFRASLAASPSSKQVFDPWLMDADTRDTVAATPNLQRKHDENEKLHAHHLHLTVREPKILS